MLYGQEALTINSRFINEINDELIDIDNKQEPKIKIVENKIYDTEQIYKYGDKIEHETYGIGVVIEVNKTLITVAFNKNIGIKKLLKNHKSIKKI